MVARCRFAGSSEPTDSRVAPQGPHSAVLRSDAGVALGQRQLRPRNGSGTEGSRQRRGSSAQSRSVRVRFGNSGCCDRGYQRDCRDH